MSAEVSSGIRQSLQRELSKIESTTDLDNMTILSRTGMKIATATTSEIDADPITASSAALIDVGVRFNNNMEHGDLREILIRSGSGYTILMYIDNQFMTFAGLPNLSRIGYYLELLRIKCKLFSFILADNQVTDELKQEIESQKEKEDKKDIEEQMADLFESDKSSDEDLGAMQDVLNFLDDWGADEGGTGEDSAADNIVGIDEDILMGMDFGDVPEDGVVRAAPAATDAATKSAASAGKAEEDASKFKVYDDEVPPVPLDDVEALEIGGSQQEASTETEVTETVPEQEPEPSAAPSFKEETFEPKFDDLPDFDAMKASEYEDVDVDLSEEDAMFEALEDLGYVDEKKKKK